MDMELLTDFLNEAKDLLEVTDEKLVDLEKYPEDEKLLNAVFRGYHTIKGGAGFLELTSLVRLCHALETLFDALRSGHLVMNKSIMNASLEASNNIRVCMNMLSVNPDAQFTAPENLIEELLGLANGTIIDEPASEHDETIDSIDSHVEQIEPDPTVALHDESSLTAANDAPSAKHGASANPSGFADDDYWASLHRVFSPLVPTQKPMQAPAPKMAPKPQPITAALEEKTVPPPKRTTAPTEAPKAEKDNQIKVDTNRLDAVLTLASEVGLAKNRVGSAKAKIVSKDFSDSALADLDRAFNDLDRLTSSLQNAVMLTRMQPIGRLFTRYPRVVRDLARTLGKNIDIDITGHDTEIDKGMIEDLADPLVHLIRNSADHGIESPDIRKRGGKPETGKIQLHATQEGDRILIEITDDGKGMDPAFIRSKAKSKGVLDFATIDAMSDRQALEMIFLPGFSTAEALSSVSGRGVGMDVVKTNINKMGGEITIDSTAGTGTSIQIRLPLTLAVLPALILRAANQSLALPLSSVQEILSLSEHTPQLAGGKPVINLRGEIIRVMDLSELLGWGASDTATVAALVDLGRGNRVALRAEGFIGREEVMVKSLEGTKPKGVSGVMVDAQGEIVLILDLKELLAGTFFLPKDKNA